MLLLNKTDEVLEELQKLADQVICRFDDMVPAPNMKGVFRLPKVHMPESASVLFDFFYDKKRDEIYKWAESKGLHLIKKTYHGPQIVFFKPGGSTWHRENRLSFSIVIPTPHGVKDVDQVSAQQCAISQDVRMRVRIQSPIANGIVVDSFPHLDVGDVLVLEEKEVLLIEEEKPHVTERKELLRVGMSQDPTKEVHGICLVSALHITSQGKAGEGGWGEGAANRDEGNRPVS